MINSDRIETNVAIQLEHESKFHSLQHKARNKWWNLLLSNSTQLRNCFLSRLKLVTKTKTISSFEFHQLSIYVHKRHLVRRKKCRFTKKVVAWKMWCSYAIWSISAAAALATFFLYCQVEWSNWWLSFVSHEFMSPHIFNLLAKKYLNPPSEEFFSYHCMSNSKNWNIWCNFSSDVFSNFFHI
jgi:hypothetical protein